ncbi:MAG TPA: hypothetical protein VFS57_09565, partial [Gemmatimonadaceae bacterium]|nr:hypothetical protein [Gemmatimonadaceae bacterium]
MKSLCSALLAASLSVGLSASASTQTTTVPQRSLFTWRDGVLAGGFVVATIAARPIDKSAAIALQRPER